METVSTPFRVKTPLKPLKLESPEVRHIQFWALSVALFLLISLSDEAFLLMCLSDEVFFVFSDLIDELILAEFYFSIHIGSKIRVFLFYLFLFLVLHIFFFIWYRRAWVSLAKKKLQ